jgi:hypothetical protein|tara:strand:- start:148 stop:270 length:123 start_codon:yes stop_codon:yes gene_type:complete
MRIAACSDKTHDIGKDGGDAINDEGGGRANASSSVEQKKR